MECIYNSVQHHITGFRMQPGMLSVQHRTFRHHNAGCSKSAAHAAVNTP